MPVKQNFCSCYIVPAVQHTKIQLPSSVIFRDMEGSQNQKWGLLISHTHAETFTHVASTWQVKQFAIFQHRSSNALSIVQLCGYVFAIGFPLYVLQNGFLGGF